MSIFSSEALRNKHIIITGATGGIGWSTAELVCQMGANVTITGRDEPLLEKLKDRLSSSHFRNKIITVSGDLTDEAFRRELVEKSMEENSVIDGLVNSAAIAGGKTVDKLEEKDLVEKMDINYVSTVLLTKLVYHEMLKNRSGAIVNVSSLSGLRGTFGNTAYAASKFALIGFTQSMAVEAAIHNIRVNAVCPGFVDTKMGRATIQRKADRNNITFEQQLEKINRELPSGRITTPNEVANTIAFLLTDAAQNIIGESVKISGGTVMR